MTNHKLESVRECLKCFRVLVDEETCGHGRKSQVDITDTFLGRRVLLNRSLQQVQSAVRGELRKIPFVGRFV